MLGPAGGRGIRLKLFALRGREGGNGATFPHRPRQERFCGLHGCGCSGSSVSCSDSSSNFMPSNILALSRYALSSIRDFRRATTILLHCTAKNIDNSTSKRLHPPSPPLQSATMTKRTKSKPSLPSLPYEHLALPPANQSHRGRRHGQIRHQVSTPSLLPPTSSLLPLLCPPPLLNLNPRTQNRQLPHPFPHQSTNNNGCVRKQIRRLPPQTSEEDGNLPTRPLHLHLLRQDDGQAAQRRHLELQELQEDGRWGSVDGFVSWRSLFCR